MELTLQEYNDTRKWQLPSDEDGSVEGYMTEDLLTHHKTWMPKKVFHANFIQIENK